jgi:hypothetical protein
MSIDEGDSKYGSRGDETVTSFTQKVPAGAIEHVRKESQNAPDCTTKARPKRQAIRTLIP